MNKYLAPHLFIILHKGDFILWNCESHTQFEIEISYLKRLQEIDKNPNSLPSPLDEELLKTGAITTVKPENQEWNWDPLSRLYHIGTKDIHENLTLSEKEWIENYLSFSQTILENSDLKTVDLDFKIQETEIILPKIYEPKNYNLWQALKERETTRRFNGNPLSEKDLATLLFYGFGKIHGNSWKNAEKLPVEAYGYRRAHPSGGALQPVQGYVMVFDVGQIPQGIYYYSSEQHTLGRVIKFLDVFCRLS
jgi:hypothetical protein